MRLKKSLKESYNAGNFTVNRLPFPSSLSASMVPPVEKHNLGDHGTGPVPGRAGLAGGIYLVEALPDFVQVLCRDADAVILHRKHSERSVLPGSLAGQATRICPPSLPYLAGVFQEIDDNRESWKASPSIWMPSSTEASREMLRPPVSCSSQMSGSGA